MRANPNPILLSSMQFHTALTAGAKTQLDLFDAAHRLGADGVELRDAYWRDRPAEIAAIRRAATERNLVVTYATMSTLFSPNGDGEARLRQDVDDAVALGSPFVRVFQGQLPEDGDRAAWDRARRVVEYAAAQGIDVALENFARAPGSRLAEIKHVLDAIPAAALGTNVDIGNYAHNGEDALTAIDALAPRIVASHLKDVRGPDTTWLGDGDLPLAAILAAFDALPQAVVHCLEFDGGDDPDERIAASLRLVRAGA